jgi:hypothetical protein
MSASEVLGIILITLVLVIQLAAAVYALLLIRLTGRNRAWLLMAMALGASAVAMAVVFVDEVLIDHEPDLALPAQLGGLLIDATVAIRSGAHGAATQSAERFQPGALARRG